MVGGVRKTQRPTMKDVARVAGVSIQTVSVAINHPSRIAPETRDRILAAIDQLGYRPLVVARSLRTGSTNTIALVVSDITNPFFARMADAVEDQAHKAGYNLILYNTHADPERERGYLHMAAQRWVDGVLFVTTTDTMNGLDALAAAGITYLAIDRIPDGYDGPWVILDNQKTGAIVGEHLLDLGHRRLAHISGPLELRLSRERLRSFEAAIRARGLEPLPHETGDSTWSCASGYQAMRRLLEAASRPTAVFAANDRLAIGATRAAVEAGLRVPEDISIAGVDDIESAGYQSPPLTTVRQRLQEVATLGTKTLLDLLRGEKEVESRIEFEPELVIRESTAAPAIHAPQDMKEVQPA